MKLNLRRAAGAVFLCALVVLAGCAGTGPWSNANMPRENATTTPGAGSAAPQSTANGQASPPPGVSEQGLTNLTKLVQTNRKKLFETGYISAVRLRGKMTSKGKTRNLSMAQREVVEPGASEYLFQVQRSAGPTNYRSDVWSNESAAYVRTSRGGPPSYRQTEPGRITSQLTGGQLLSQYAGAGEFTLDSINESGKRTLYTLTADEYVRQPTKRMPAPKNVSFYQAQVVVDSQGRVHYFEVKMQYAGPQGGQAQLHLQYGIRKIGNVSVTRPDWVDEAQSPSNSTATESGDGHSHG